MCLGLDNLPQWGMVVVISIIIAGLTEVTSNVATANILLPVLAEVAIATKTNPLYLMIPATLSCSYAFMLPVATPPNAIVYTASGMSTGVMVSEHVWSEALHANNISFLIPQIKCGFFVNVFCVATNFLCLSTYGSLIYSLDDNAPGWLT